MKAKGTKQRYHSTRTTAILLRSNDLLRKRYSLGLPSKEISRTLTVILLLVGERFRGRSFLTKRIFNASKCRLFFGATRRWLVAVNAPRTEVLHQRHNNEGGHAEAMLLLDESLAISSELGMRPLMERVLSRREILKA